MDAKVYGYARVSTKNQHEDRQLAALRDYGIRNQDIVVEKQSGKDFDRPLYQKLLKKLRPGDTLVITSIDRLGRNYSEIIEQWRILSREQGVAIVVLEMPLLNTQENAELISRLITDLVLQVFSYVAETERENIRRRQQEGIEAAKARGVRFGRPRVETPEEFPEIVRRWKSGEISSHTAAALSHVSRSTFFRRAKELEQGQVRHEGSQTAQPETDDAPVQNTEANEVCTHTDNSEQSQNEQSESDGIASNGKRVPQRKHRFNRGRKATVKCGRNDLNPRVPCKRHPK